MQIDSFENAEILATTCMLGTIQGQYLLKTITYLRISPNLWSGVLELVVGAFIKVGFFFQRYTVVVPVVKVRNIYLYTKVHNK